MNACEPGRRVPNPALVALVCAMALGANVPRTLGDTLVLKDGRSFEGRLIDRGDDKVSFEVHVGSSKVVVAFRASEVAAIKPSTTSTPVVASAPPASSRAAEDAKGPRYYYLPIVGEVGKEVRFEGIQAALADANSRNPDAIVLFFDSPGGDIAEMDRIIALLGKNTRIRTIAFVRKALSAAAIIALACPEIYMTADGSIGQAAPYRIGPKAASEPAEEKLQPAVRPMIRAAAEAGGHPVLIARGMIEPDLELSLTTHDGKVVVVEGEGGKPFKPKGKVLTLTAQEALDCGLAKGIAKDIGALHQPVGVGPWAEAIGAGRYLMVQKAITAQKEDERQRRELAREARRQEIAPRLAEIAKALEKVRAGGRAAESARDSLARQYDAEVEAVHADYNRVLYQAMASQTVNPKYAASLMSSAAEYRNRKLLEIRDRYRPDAVTIEDKINTLNQEQKRLVKEKSELEASVLAPK